jgi:phage tail sheath gpL-like
MTIASAAMTFAAVAGAFAQQTWTPAQKQVESLPIYRNFVASRVAATRCNALDAASDRKFEANFPAVSADAARTLAAQHPGASKAEIDRQMKAMDQEARTAVDTEIAQTGCSSPEVQQLVQLYRSHRTH